MCRVFAAPLQPLASGQSNDDPKTFWRHLDAPSEIASAYVVMITVSTRTGKEQTLMTLKQVADVEFPTRWACFRLLAFEAVHANTKTGKERLESVLALILGDIHSFPPLVRIHSQCTTGEVFHSLRCDCHDQLHLALRVIAEEGAGVLLYEQQEGRGIGLMEKLRAYELQDRGFDTIDANLHLGHVVDSRDYAIPTQVLHFLNVRSVRLMSNNPEKIKAVFDSGIQIVERVGADVPVNPYSSRYMSTKRNRLGHLINSPTDAPSDETVTVQDALLSETHAETAAAGAGGSGDHRGGSWRIS
jgi:GTP cyclohydrolase II